MRLQSIGQGDSRRGIIGYYNLAQDARAEIAKVSGEDKTMWRERLKELGIVVGNALVEMGNLEGAVRHLESLRVKGHEEDQIVTSRLALLYLRLGDMTAVRRYIFSRGHDGSETLSNKLLLPLLSMAEGRYEDAVQGWRALLDSSPGENNAMITQNLAVCLLYTDKAEEASLMINISYSYFCAAMIDS